MQATNIKRQINVDAIKNEIASKMDAACFSSWINPLNFSVENGVLVLTAPNQFTADFVSATYSNIINNVARDYDLSVCVRVGATKIVATRGANDNNAQTYSAPVVADVKQYSDFDSFVSCEENAFVLSACKKMAAGAVSFSPLFIYGPAGCGKSTLGKLTGKSVSCTCIKNCTKNKGCTHNASVTADFNNIFTRIRMWCTHNANQDLIQNTFACFDMTVMKHM